MATYRKLPVEIEAFLWTGGPDQVEDPQWIVDAITAGTVTFRNLCTPAVDMVIETLEGKMIANVGDYVIRGVKGEIYPCKAEIFNLTYELVSE